MPLIAFEGGDGVGKATQSKRLTDELRKFGHPVSLYSFPRYDTDVGRAIRRHLTGGLMVAEEHAVDSSDHTIDGTVVHRRAHEDALFFQSLMLADKCDASMEMRMELARGAFVVCDRWADSSLAYGVSDGLHHGWLERVHSVLPQADVTFYLKVPESVAFERRPVLRDRYENDRGKQQVVARNYDELARTKPGWFVVDGSRTIEEVGLSIWGILTTRLNHFFDA